MYYFRALFCLLSRKIKAKQTNTTQHAVVCSLRLLLQILSLPTLERLPPKGTEHKAHNMEVQQQEACGAL